MMTNKHDVKEIYFAVRNDDGTFDYKKFKRSYDKYVKLLAKILRDRGLSVEKGLWTHYDVTKRMVG